MKLDPADLAKKAMALLAATRVLVDRAIAILQRLRAALERIVPGDRP